MDDGKNGAPRPLYDPLDVLRQRGYDAAAQAIGLTLGSVGMGHESGAEAARSAYHAIAGALAGVVLGIEDKEQAEQISNGEPLAVAARLLLMLAEQGSGQGWHAESTRSELTASGAPAQTRHEVTIIMDGLEPDNGFNLVHRTLDLPGGEIHRFGIVRLSVSGPSMLPGDIRQLPFETSQLSVATDGGTPVPLHAFDMHQPSHPIHIETIVVHGPAQPADPQS